MAENGNAEAQFRLGGQYVTGNGVKSDPREGFLWVAKAAEQGHSEALIVYKTFHGSLPEGQMVAGKAFPLFKDKAKQGDVVAARIVGLCYLDGFGVEQSYEDSFKWFMVSAEQGDVSAQLRLREMYELGQGVAVDEKAAVHWTLKAANQNSSDAQLLMASYYCLGKGVKKDNVQAAMWVILASKQGNDAAAELGQVLSLQMNWAERKEAAELAHEWVPNK